MNFFNIGTAELMLIFVIALIVVGPRRLPEVSRSLGKVVNDVRQMSREFTAPITQELTMPVEVNETKEIADQSVSEKAVHGDQG
jgi:sec-independent protein translocase protein TatB